MGKPKKDEQQQQIGELTQDLQRVRADFENYRKRVDAEKVSARQAGEASAVLKLLPVVDTIERATQHIPADIAEHQWVRGVSGLVKQLDTVLAGLDLVRIPAAPGDAFNPELHDAVQFDEDAEGEHEVIAAELQPGYTYKGIPIRHAMVKVTKK
ncbi:MAG: nucleotide exchange factor GrpE [Candidatus Saccharimonadales bacterium]